LITPIDILGLQTWCSWFDFSEESIMKLEDVRSFARSHSIKPDHLSKSALIKTIQVDEGNFDCFATACSGECDQSACLWREDCFDSAHHKGELS
jgi:hypothetical protein